MGSGTVQIKNGAIQSTNALLPVVCGFKPRSVKLFLSGGASAFWNEAMADDSAYQRIIAGTGSLITSDGIIPTENGFTIGASALLNPATAQIIHFEALQ